MKTSSKRRIFEVRFSLLSLVALLFCWVGISLVAFYLGFLMGRTGEMDKVGRRHSVRETAVAFEDEPRVAFPDVLSDSKAEDHSLPEREVVGPATAIHEPPPPPGIPPTKHDVSQEASRKLNTARGRVIQVASFREQAGAEKLVAELEKKGYRCFSSRSVQPETKKAYYRVFVGPVPDEQDALRLKDELEKREGYRDIMIRSAYP